MRIERGKIAFAVMALLLAALFVHLGFWQLDRHLERREANRLRSERTGRPVLEASSGADLVALPPPESLAWRRIRLRGRWDFEHEILVAPRSHAGRPAIELLTPLLLADGTAVLVLRGWLPAPDGLHAPILRARPATEEASPEGVVMPPARSVAGRRSAGSTEPSRVTVDGERHVALRAPDLETASRFLPYTVALFYVRTTDKSGAESDIRPLPPLEPGAGPHLSYAVQWFAFALIAIGGTAAFLHKGR